MLVKIVVWALLFLSAFPTINVSDIPQGKTSLLEPCVVYMPLHMAQSELPLSSCFTLSCSLQSFSMVKTLRKSCYGPSSWSFLDSYKSHYKLMLKQSYCLHSLNSNCLIAFFVWSGLTNCSGTWTEVYNMLVHIWGPLGMRSHQGLHRWTRPPLQWWKLQLSVAAAEHGSLKRNKFYSLLPFEVKK